MNCLAIDFGIKRIGLAISIQGIISPLSVVPNDKKFIDILNKEIKDHNIGKIYVGVSEGEVADLTKKFVEELITMVQLPIETVEEAVSTIEAEEIYIRNKRKKKDYKKQIDSVAAAVILRRALG